MSAAEADIGLQMIALCNIEPDPAQPRRHFDAAELDSLAASIREHGVIEPIVVKPLGAGRYQLLAGERRWRASQLAGLSTIPAMVRNEGGLALQLAENLQRADLTLYEEAQALAQLLAEQSLDAVAAGLGRGKSWVSRRAAVVSMPAHVRQLAADRLVNEVDVLHDLQRIDRLDSARCTQLIREARSETSPGLRRARTRAVVDELEGRLKRLADKSPVSGATPPAGDVAASGSHSLAAPRAAMGSAAADNPAATAKTFGVLGAALAGPLTAQRLVEVSASLRATGTSMPVDTAPAKTSVPQANNADADLEDADRSVNRLATALAYAFGGHCLGTGQVHRDKTMRDAGIVVLTLTLPRRCAERALQTLTKPPMVATATIPHACTAADAERFCRAALRKERGAVMELEDMRAAYLAWCVAEGIIPWEIVHPGLDDALARFGAQKHKLRRGRVYRGVCLRLPRDETEIGIESAELEYLPRFASPTGTRGIRDEDASRS